MEAKQPPMPSHMQSCRPLEAVRIASVDQFGAADPAFVAQPCLYFTNWYPKLQIFNVIIKSDIEKKNQMAKRLTTKQS